MCPTRTNQTKRTNSTSYSFLYQPHVPRHYLPGIANISHLHVSKSLIDSGADHLTVFHTSANTDTLSPCVPYTSARNSLSMLRDTASFLHHEVTHHTPLQEALMSEISECGTKSSKPTNGWHGYGSQALRSNKRSLIYGWNSLFKKNTYFFFAKLCRISAFTLIIRWVGNVVGCPEAMPIVMSQSSGDDLCTTAAKEHLGGVFFEDNSKRSQPLFENDEFFLCSTAMAKEQRPFKSTCIVTKVQIK